MDIINLKEVLQEIDKVGITECVIEPGDEDGKTRIRGASKDTSVIIFDTIDSELTEVPIGIQSVKGFLSRLKLFDGDKASIALKSNDKFAVNATIKQGRRLANFRFAPPNTLQVPDAMPDCEEPPFIELDEQYVDFLSTAIASMSYTGSKEERTISMKVNDGDLGINIFDGEDDCFDDVMEVEGVTELHNGSWELVPFHLVMKQSRLYNDTKAIFTINDYGVAIFKLETIKVMVSPMMG